MALELVNNPGQTPDMGIFNLPPDFPRDEFAAEWVEENNVAFKQQRQPMPGTGYSADGWSIYKPAGGNGKAVRVVTGGKNGKTYVLMVRPLALQRQVNAVYGNVSKQRISRETKGETVAGGPLQDPGMLTEQHLKRVQGGGPGNETGDVELNPVESAPEIIAT